MGNHLTVPPVQFWKYVNKTETCWLWTGYIQKQGYGQFTAPGNPGRKKNRAHRYAYELMIGPIPEGLVTDHLCRVRHCVNPEHLELVTTAENTYRGLKGTLGRRTHCKRGHLYDETNTYFRKDWGRRCRTCLRENRK